MEYNTGVAQKKKKSKKKCGLATQTELPALNPNPSTKTLRRTRKQPDSRCVVPVGKEYVTKAKEAMQNMLGSKFGVNLTGLYLQIEDLAGYPSGDVSTLPSVEGTR